MIRNYKNFMTWPKLTIRFYFLNDTIYVEALIQKMVETEIVLESGYSLLLYGGPRFSIFFPKIV